jgi:hypothetical protein
MARWVIELRIPLLSGDGSECERYRVGGVSTVGLDAKSRSENLGFDRRVLHFSRLDRLF